MKSLWSGDKRKRIFCFSGMLVQVGEGLVLVWVLRWICWWRGTVDRCGVGRLYWHMLVFDSSWRWGTLLICGAGACMADVRVECFFFIYLIFPALSLVRFSTSLKVLQSSKLVEFTPIWIFCESLSRFRTVIGVGNRSTFHAMQRVITIMITCMSIHLTNMSTGGGPSGLIGRSYFTQSGWTF